MADSKLWRVHHDDVGSILAVKASAKNANSLNRTQGKDYSSPDWFGPDLSESSGAACRKLYATGWQQGAKRIAATVTQDVPLPQSIRRRRKRGDQGDELDIHAVYAGHLDNAWWRAQRAARAGRKNVTIIAPVNIACQYSTDDVFWRGACVAKLADMLSDAGYNVSFVGAIISTGIDNGYTTDMLHTVDLKTASQPLDVPNLAAALAHTGFMRSVGFTLIASQETALSECYGMNDPGTMNRMLADLAAEYNKAGDNAIFCPYTTLNQDASEAWLAEQAAKFAAPAMVSA